MMDNTSQVHDDDDGECPVVAAARVISGKWTLLVLRDLDGGPKRFTELERSLVGISPRTLSQRLRALESEAIIDRHAYCETPPRVEYRLTAKGEALMPIVAAMRIWGEEWGGKGNDDIGELSPDRQTHTATV